VKRKRKRTTKRKSEKK
jgi:hypothetical protein